jgi:hypothetical protein
MIYGLNVYGVNFLFSRIKIFRIKKFEKFVSRNLFSISRNCLLKKIIFRIEISPNKYFEDWSSRNIKHPVGTNSLYKTLTVKEYGPIKY